MLPLVWYRGTFSHLVFVLIGRLELKIPWKNLYNQSVEATLDGVYLLIVPTASKISKIL